MGEKKEKRPCLAPVLCTVGHIWEHELYSTGAEMKISSILLKFFNFMFLISLPVIWRNFDFWRMNIFYYLLWAPQNQIKTEKK